MNRQILGSGFSYILYNMIDPSQRRVLLQYIGGELHLSTLTTI